VTQFRERERTAAVHEAVGATISSMRTQLSDARSMYLRVEAENNTLAQENNRLLALNAELRARCELLQSANTNTQPGNDPTRAASPSMVRRSHSPKIITRQSSSFTLVPSPLSSPILASPFEANYEAPIETLTTHIDNNKP